MYRFDIECLEKKVELAYNIGTWIKRIKWRKPMKPMSEDMKQIKVVKRRGQNEHLKQGERTKKIYILQQ